MSPQRPAPSRLRTVRNTARSTVPHAALRAVPIAALFLLVSVSVAAAQVCMGLPTAPGEMSIQGDIATTGSEASYGGRLGMNFNTEFTLDLSMHRPSFEHGTGTVLEGRFGYEMEEYRPPVCFTLGVLHERAPSSSGEESGTTMIPVGVGVGKRLGTTRGLSLSLFVMPEYIIVANPAPADEFENFWDELGQRSEGRGTLGLLLATPFLYTSGSVEVSTRNDFEPTISLGLGVIF